MKSRLLIVAGIALIAIAVAGWAFGYTKGEVTTVRTVGKTVTVKTDPPQTVTTSVDHPPSDALLSALIGSGAALLLIGTLSGRIHTVKVPNVLELDLGEKEAVAKAVAKSVQTKHPNATPAQAAQIGALVTAKALPALAALKAAAPSDQITDEQADVIAGYLTALS